MSADERTSRQLVREQLHAHKVHELIPKSGKVVVFDADLSLRHALDALAEHALTFAPVWDSARQDFCAMLSADDFTRLLARLGRDAHQGAPPGQAPATARAPEDMTIHDALALCPPPPGPGLADGQAFPRLVPDETLYAAVQRLLDGRLSHVALVSGPEEPQNPAAAAAGHAAPVADSSTVLHVLTPLRVLHCVVASPLFQSNDKRIFDERICDLGIGTMLPSPQAALNAINAAAAAAAAAAGGADSGALAQADASVHGGVQGTHVLCAVPLQAPVWQGLLLMAAYGCSALPLVQSSDSAVVCAIFRSEHTLSVAQSLPHFDLSAPISSVAGSAPDPSAPPFTCRPTDTLHTAMERLSHGKLKRLFVADEAGNLVGVLTVLDVLRYFLTA